MMLSDSPNLSSDTGQTSLPTRLEIEPATQLLIESDAEPRWGKFLRHWEALAAAKGRLPARGDIDPASLGSRLLPNVLMVDIIDQPGQEPRFRYRLLGQTIVERETLRPGDFLDQFGDPVVVEAIVRHYRAAMQGKVSIRRSTQAWLDQSRDGLRYGVMMLPLSEDGCSVTQLVGLALYDY
jgi:hypothetical protein